MMTFVTRRFNSVALQPGLVLQPDILVVPSGELVKHSDIVKRLHLAIEVVSPSSARFVAGRSGPRISAIEYRSTGSWFHARARARLREVLPSE